MQDHEMEKLPDEELEVNVEAFPTDADGLEVKYVGADEMTVLEEDPQLTKEEQLEADIQVQEDKYLRLLAEYDNFRKRSIKERETAWQTAKAETAAAFFPVYDNLERALKQECKDEAYAKGVQMTMSQLKSVMEKLGIEEIPAQGETFDPTFHDAVMHVEDENVDANVIVEVFQTGFQSGGKVVRHAMVKVAN